MTRLGHRQRKLLDRAHDAGPNGVRAVDMSNGDLTRARKMVGDGLLAEENFLLRGKAYIITAAGINARNNQGR